MDMKIMIAAVLAMSCGQLADPTAVDGKPECGSDALGKITARYSIELSEACKAYDSVDQCSGEAKDKVEKKYEDIFHKWAECE